MYVLRRTVGTSITISAREMIELKLVGIDWLGACALLQITRGTSEPKRFEMGAGERMELDPDVRIELLKLSYATHKGTPARVVEFGIDAPRSIAVRRTETLNGP